MTREGFEKAVKDIFQKDYGYSPEKIQAYFNTPKVKAILDDDYKYINDKSMAISPEATASTLDLMY